MKNCFLLLFILLFYGCKKDETTDNLNGSWSLKSYKIEYFDSSGKKIHQVIPSMLYGFQEIVISRNSLTVTLAEEDPYIPKTPSQFPFAIFTSCTAERKGCGILLNWTANVDKDLRSFVIYRNGNLIGVVDINESLPIQHSYSYYDQSFRLENGHNYLIGFSDINSGSSGKLLRLSATVGGSFSESKLNIVKNKDEKYILFPKKFVNAFEKVNLTETDDILEWTARAENVEYYDYDSSSFKTSAYAKLDMKFLSTR